MRAAERPDRYRHPQVLIDFLQADNANLRKALRVVRLSSLLDIRRAAFAPEIGVRYTEAIRADICGAVRALEEHIDATLDEQNSDV